MEESEIMEELRTIIKKLEAISESGCWSYTREYGMGQLDAALIVIQNVLEDLNEMS